MGQNFKIIILAFMVSLVFLNCEAVAPDESLFLEDPEPVRIIYNGLAQEQNASLASFTLVNDSADSLQYFGYDQQSMHYSTEALADTGWTYLFWNWCGTGADYHILEPDNQVDFYTSLPNQSCTWRVVLSISDMDSSNTYLLKSESLLYIAP